MVRVKKSKKIKKKLKQKSSKTRKKVLKSKKKISRKLKPAEKLKQKRKTVTQKTLKKKKYEFLKDKEIFDFLYELVGKDGLKVVKKITDNEVSDVELTEKMKIKANIIRKHLYTLYESGVVTYRRHRSKTGWYTYYWKLNPERLNLAINEMKRNTLTKLQDVLEYEKANHFFECGNKCTRVIFDDALELGFKCMKCAKPLEYTSNLSTISKIEKQIAKLSEELSV